MSFLKKKDTNSSSADLTAPKKSSGLFGRMFESTSEDMGPRKSKGLSMSKSQVFTEVKEKLEDKEKVMISKGTNDITIGLSGAQFELSCGGYDTFMYHVGSVDSFTTEYENDVKYYEDNAIPVKTSDHQQIRIQFTNSLAFKHILIRIDDDAKVKQNDKATVSIYDTQTSKVIVTQDFKSNKDDTLKPCFLVFYIYFSTADGVWRIVNVNQPAEKVAEGDILALKKMSLSEDTVHPRLPLNFVEIPKILNIKILKVSDLNIKDATKCDPYCLVQVGSQKYKTKPQKQTNSPVFEEQLNIPIPDSLLKEIKIEVWNWQNKTEFLGQITMPSGKAMFNKKFTARLKPVPGKETEQAHLKGSIEFLLDVNKDSEAKETIKSTIFGQELVKVMERNSETEAIPRQLKPLFEFLLKHGPKYEGIFRISGQKDFIDQWVIKLDEGELLPLGAKNIEDLCHNVSSIVKKYIRELPTPILTYELYDDFLKTNFVEDDKKEEALATLLQKIPVEHMNLLYELLVLCAAVEAKKDSNKMTPENLAVVFGLGILKHKDEMKTTMDIAQIQKVFIALLHLLPTLFKDKFPQQ